MTSTTESQFLGLMSDDFEVFKRQSRQYSATDTATREHVTLHYTRFKHLIESVKSRVEDLPFEVQISQWQNSGQLTPYFWAHFRLDTLSASGISISMFEKSLNVRLEYKAAQAENSALSLADFNSRLLDLREGDFDPALIPHLAVWIRREYESGPWLSFSEFAASAQSREALAAKVAASPNENWLNVGRIWRPEQAIAEGAAIVDRLAEGIRSLLTTYRRLNRKTSPLPRFWKISPGEDAAYLKEFLAHNAVTMNWNDLGDVSSAQSLEDMVALCKRDLPPTADWRPQHGYIAKQHWRFAKEMAIGDRIVVYSGARIFAIGEVLSPYMHRQLPLAGHHQRQVHWLRRFEPGLNIKENERLYKECSAYATILPLQDSENAAWLASLLNGTEAPMTASVPQATKHLTQEDGIYAYFSKRGFHFPSEVITNYALALKTKPFVILTGISGTGKTKIAQLFAEYHTRDEVERLVGEKPADTDDAFHVVVGRALLNHRFLPVSAAIQEYFDVPAAGQSQEVEVRLPGGPTQTARLLNINFADPGAAGQVRLNFKKEQQEWLKARVKQGDFLRVTVADDHLRIEPVAPVTVRKAQRERVAFISVRPDWTDNRGLLGYYNPLIRRYVPTDLLALMLRAEADPKRPYFAILDEMNLAKVEHYFSDFLSCLESRREGPDGEIQQEGLVLHHESERVTFGGSDGEPVDVPCSLKIPPNLFFTGTVNIDETTYMFSPKVLDRANTIEFNDVDLMAYGRLASPDSAVDGFRLKGDLSLESFKLPTMQAYDALPGSTKELLAALNDVLMPFQLHFGYRVANEIALYLYHAEALVGDSATALDLQILQKVLPKLHGSRAKLERPLESLLYFCVHGQSAAPHECETWVKAHRGSLTVTRDSRLTRSGAKADENRGDVRFPRAGCKVWRMLQALATQGYASYIV